MEIPPYGSSQKTGTSRKSGFVSGIDYELSRPPSRSPRRRTPPLALAKKSACLNCTFLQAQNEILQQQYNSMQRKLEVMERNQLEHYLPNNMLATSTDDITLKILELQHLVSGTGNRRNQNVTEEMNMRFLEIERLVKEKVFNSPIRQH